MRIELAGDLLATLAEYAGVPIAFQVDRILDVTNRAHGAGGFILSERRLAVPYIKDYDATEREGPRNWARRFDLSQWALIVSRDEERLIGGAAVNFNAVTSTIANGIGDVAALWDIRVRPDSRRRGLGAALFAAVETLATSRGCSRLEVETQNINVPACRLYERQGCVLRAAHRLAYPDFPDETQLLWHKHLRNGLSDSEPRPR